MKQNIKTLSLLENVDYVSLFPHKGSKIIISLMIQSGAKPVQVAIISFIMD